MARYPFACPGHNRTTTRTTQGVRDARVFSRTGSTCKRFHHSSMGLAGMSSAPASAGPSPKPGWHLDALTGGPSCPRPPGNHRGSTSMSTWARSIHLLCDGIACRSGVWPPSAGGPFQGRATAGSSPNSALGQHTMAAVRNPAGSAHWRSRAEPVSGQDAQPAGPVDTLCLHPHNGAMRSGGGEWSAPAQPDGSLATMQRPIIPRAPGGRYAISELEERAPSVSG